MGFNDFIRQIGDAAREKARVGIYGANYRQQAQAMQQSEEQNAIQSALANIRLQDQKRNEGAELVAARMEFPDEDPETALTRYRASRMLKEQGLKDRGQEASIASQEALAGLRGAQESDYESGYRQRMRDLAMKAAEGKISAAQMREALAQEELETKRYQNSRRTQGMSPEASSSPYAFIRGVADPSAPFGSSVMAVRKDVPPGTSTPVPIAAEKAPATVSNRIEAAKNSLIAGQNILNELQRPEVRSKIGPALGRAGNVKAWLGSGDPEFRQLQGQIMGFASLQPNIHGMRNVRMVNELVDNLFQTANTPEALAAAINGILDVSRIVSQTGGETASEDLIRAFQSAGRGLRTTPVPQGQTTPAAPQGGGSTGSYQLVNGKVVFVPGR